MKKLFLIAAALCFMVSCNKEIGDQYKVAPVVSNVSFSPSPVTPSNDVTVTAQVDSQYGLNFVYIIYILDGDETKRNESGLYFYNKNNTSISYTGKIPKQAAGTKVSFMVCAVSSYSVFGASEVFEYTVREIDELEPIGTEGQ